MIHEIIYLDISLVCLNYGSRWSDSFLLASYCICLAQNRNGLTGLSDKTASIVRSTREIIIYNLRFQIPSNHLTTIHLCEPLLSPSIAISDSDSSQSYSSLTSEIAEAAWWVNGERCHAATVIYLVLPSEGLNWNVVPGLVQSIRGLDSHSTMERASLRFLISYWLSSHRS